MATYDDRPISVYDNLNMPTSTPKSKPQTIMTTTSTTSPNKLNLQNTINGTATSPYADIAFKFNENNTQTPLLPCNNPSLSRTSNQFILNTPSNNNNSNNNYTYATIFKPATTPTTTIQTQAQTPISTFTGINNATALTNASPVLRPLSQHSQTDLNEATVQSIAAVKAALHDAKSKFFGLNDYTSSSENNCNNNHTSFEAPSNQYQQQFLYDTPTTSSTTTSTTTPTSTSPQRPKVQILTPPPKPTPKYQNIPENSAIFRNLTPPERPPKPIHFQSSSPVNLEASTPMQQHTPMNMADVQQQLSTSPTPTHSLPHMTYKQVPLNDIEVCTPSQAVYMSTTVPQNIKGTKIAGRHTPTRNSLRHSRMLVVNNKNYQDVQHPNPMNLKHPNFARWLLILQILISILILCVAIWIFVLAPNTAIQENPYWSGLILLFAGILGLVLIRYRRIQRDKVRENCFLFLRADSYVLTLTAALLCCVAAIFAAIHFSRLMARNTYCESSNILQEHASCLCTFNLSPSMLAAKLASNQTFEEENALWLRDGEQSQQNAIDENDQSYKIEYRDLSCEEVTCEWTHILGFSMGLNALGLLVTFIYIVLLACHRYDSKRIYTSVQTSTF